MSRDTVLLLVALLAALVAARPPLPGAEEPQRLAPADSDKSDEEEEERLGRIVGGSSIGSPNKYPFLTAVIKKPRLGISGPIPPGTDLTNGQWCGGSLLDPSVVRSGQGEAVWVLSAAHCFPRNADPNDWAVFIHGYDLKQRGQYQHSCTEVIDVAQVVCHRDYDNRSFKHDVCLLRLVAPPDCAADMAANNKLAFLDAADGCASVPGVQECGSAAVEDAMMTTAGWGSTSYGGSYPKLAREVDVPLGSDEKCRDQYGGDIKDGMICAGYDSGGMDSCSGDSGGPLFKTVDGKFVVTGVVSWGYGCAEGGHWGVYASVSSYRGWVVEQVREPSAWSYYLGDEATACAAGQDITSYETCIAAMGEIGERVKKVMVVDDAGEGNKLAKGCNYRSGNKKLYWNWGDWAGGDNSQLDSSWGVKPVCELMAPAGLCDCIDQLDWCADTCADLDLGGLQAENPTCHNLFVSAGICSSSPVVGPAQPYSEVCPTTCDDGGEGSYTAGELKTACAEEAIIPTEEECAVALSQLSLPYRKFRTVSASQGIKNKLQLGCTYKEKASNPRKSQVYWNPPDGGWEGGDNSKVKWATPICRAPEGRRLAAAAGVAAAEPKGADGGKKHYLPSFLRRAARPAARRPLEE